MPDAAKKAWEVVEGMAGVEKRKLLAATLRACAGDYRDFVEYSADGVDLKWVELLNARRLSDEVEVVSVEAFERCLDYFERQNESHKELKAASAENDDDASCCVCLRGDSTDSNVILYCDRCNVAVHQVKLALELRNPIHFLNRNATAFRIRQMVSGCAGAACCRRIARCLALSARSRVAPSSKRTTVDGLMWRARCGCQGWFSRTTRSWSQSSESRTSIRRV